MIPARAPFTARVASMPVSGSTGNWREIAAALSALTLLIAAPSSAQPSAATAAADSAHAERALKLAQILNSEANIIGDEKSDEQAIAIMSQFVASSAELSALEKETPGFMLALGREILPIANRSMRERLPGLHRRQAALYGATFSLAELDVLIEFYGSPTGAKLITVLMAKVKPTAMIAEASKSEDFTFGEQAALKDIRSTVPDIMRSMTKDDNAALVRFAQSGLAPKIRAMAAQTQKIAIDWMNEEAPWEAKATDEAVALVMARFEGKKE